MSFTKTSIENSFHNFMSHTYEPLPYRMNARNLISNEFFDRKSVREKQVSRIWRISIQLRLHRNENLSIKLLTLCTLLQNIASDKTLSMYFKAI